MDILEGKIKNIIYQNEDNGYLVALFRVVKVINGSKEYLKRTITITGNIIDIKLDTLVRITGSFTEHVKYGIQFNIANYELLIPSLEEDILDFLSSPFIKGCGKKTAQKIIEIYGKDSIEVIKKDPKSLDRIDGLNEKNKDKIYNSIINYSKSSDVIINIKSLGFSIEEASKIYSKYKDNINDIINNNIYLLNEIIDFKRLDDIFLNNYDKYDKRRIKACILETMRFISNNKGDVYYGKDDIYSILSKLFNIQIDYELYLDYLEELNKELLIVIEDNKVYLQKNYEDEFVISELLNKIEEKEIVKKDYIDKIKRLEKELSIEYNDEQIKAINEALNNNITIISGGPGTGKTTIINAIVKLYIDINKLNNIDIPEQIALLAPTGRASKKMSLATNIPASTIHRYLKWNKESNSFLVDEKNKNIQKLIIIDEMSMIDLSLLTALLKGIYTYVKLIFVGDSFQLPSIGTGQVLKDLIDSELFNYISLSHIYRQSDNSYIPYLAKEIKNKDLQEEYINKHDDYNFIITDNNNIKMTIKKIVEAGIKKGFNENNLQVLAPLYKGEVGIDSLNNMLRDVFNNRNDKRIIYGEIIYKINDKVLQLVNDADNNVFNGDIGYIKNIYTMDHNKEFVEIDFDGNIVIYQKKDLKNIRHAYAITIHKSQGSEFDHVIMPISYNYGSMLYNKLLYTGVSRAKKSLIIIGDPKVFYKGVFNEYGEDRKTTLKDRLFNIFLHK